MCNMDEQQNQHILLQDNTIKGETKNQKDEETHRKVHCCGREIFRVKKRTCSEWWRKYFWEGQVLVKEAQALDDSVPWHERFIHRHRRLLALAIPAIICHFFWWNLLIQQNLFYLYREKWHMAVVMILGSIMAGMTSQGGGSVAFPVMTLVFGMKPSIARDFGLQVQSIGLGCASCTILFMGVKLEHNSLVFGTFGGLLGIVMGFHWVDPYLSTPQKKLSFGAIWFSYAFALFLLNCQCKRKTFEAIPKMCLWKILVLIFAGFVGGICTSFAGNGLDICIFSVSTLLFGISEKVATPTSVIMINILSMMGWFWRSVIMYPNGVEQETNEFLIVCVGIITIGAPFGAVMGSHQHRLILASYIYVINTFSLIMALVTIPMTGPLIGLTVGLIVGGFGLFYVIMILGKKLTARLLQEEAHNSQNIQLE